MAGGGEEARRYLIKPVRVRLRLTAMGWTTFITRHPFITMLLSLALPVFSLYVLYTTYPDMLVDQGYTQFRVESDIATRRHDMQEAADQLSVVDVVPQNMPSLSGEALRLQRVSTNSYGVAGTRRARRQPRAFNASAVRGGTRQISSEYYYELLDAIQGTSPIDGGVQSAAATGASLPPHPAIRANSLRTIVVDKLTVVYLSTDGKPLTSPDRLIAMKRLENAIEDFAGYSEFCATDTQRYCRVADSVLNFFFPTISSGEIIFDGRGSLVSDTETVTRMLVENNLVGFFDRDVRTGQYSVTTVLSRFAVSLRHSSLSGAALQAEYDAVNNFLGDYNDLLFDYDMGVEVRVLFEGGKIYDRQLQQALIRDLRYALFSLTFVLLYVLFHTHSLFLACFGILGVIMSMPPAVLAHRILFGRYISMFNFISIWLILGIGADDIFIFFDTFVQAPRYNVKGRLIHLKFTMAYTYRKAVGAMLVTSVTTAATFFGNTVSDIPVIRQFGFFMGVLVVLNYVMVMTWFPACMAVWAKYYRNICSEEPLVRPGMEGAMLDNNINGANAEPDEAHFYPRDPAIERGDDRVIENPPPLELGREFHANGRRANGRRANGADGGGDDAEVEAWIRSIHRASYIGPLSSKGKLKHQSSRSSRHHRRSSRSLSRRSSSSKLRGKQPQGRRVRPNVDDEFDDDRRRLPPPPPAGNPAVPPAPPAPLLRQLSENLQSDKPLSSRCMEKYHSVLYMIRWPAILITLGIVFFFARRVPDLQPPNEPFSLLPEWHNIEKLRQLERDVLRNCEDCTTPLTNSGSVSDDGIIPRCPETTCATPPSSGGGGGGGGGSSYGPLPIAVPTTSEEEIERPSSPNKIAVTALSAKTVRVTWERPQYQGSSPVSSYTVVYSTDGQTSFSSTIFSTPTGAEREQVVTGLPPNTAIHVRVAARNAQGYGQISDAASVNTPPLSIGPMPLPTAVSSPSNAPTLVNVLVSWTAPTISGASFVGWKVHYTDSSSGVAKSVQVAAAERSVTIEEQCATRYWTVRVVCQTDLLPDQSSSWRLIQLGGLGVIPAPPPGDVVSRTHNSITIRVYRTTAKCSNIRTLTYCDVLDGGSNLIRNFSYDELATPQTITLSPLAPDTIYSASSTCNGGHGPSARVVGEARTRTLQPDPVTEIVMSNATYTSLNVSWAEPSWPGASPATIGYLLQRETGANVWTTVYNGSTTWFLETGLSNRTVYRYRAVAYNEHGLSVADSAVVLATSTLPVVPAAPEFTSMSSNRGELNISVVWAHPNPNGARIDQYEVRSNDTASSQVVLLQPVDDSVTSFHIVGAPHVQLGHSYAVSVRAHNAIGWSPWSKPYGPVNAFALTALPPPDVALHNLTQPGNRLYVTWGTPPHRGGSILSFRISVSLSIGGPFEFFVNDPALRSFALTLVDPPDGTTATVRMAARNDYGTNEWSEWSAPVSAVVRPLPCGGVVLVNDTNNNLAYASCSNHGTCHASNQSCECAAGYVGPVCEIECPGLVDTYDEESDSFTLVRPCNNHGQCSAASATTAQCTCDPGYLGDACGLSDGSNDPQTLPSYDVLEVRLVWGVVDVDNSFRERSDPNSYGRPVYDPNFNAARPEVQVYLEETCELLMNNTKMVYRATSTCPMMDFRRFVEDGLKETFPVPQKDFKVKFLKYLFQTADGGNSHGFVGMDDTGTLLWMQASFFTFTDRNAPGTELEPVYDEWESFMTERQKSAPVGAEIGFQTSAQWTRMRTELAFIKGTFWTCVISISVAFGAVIVFTGNAWLSLMSTLVIVFTLLCVMGFFVMAGMTLGAVEAVCLSLLVGLAIDYCLHLTHAFNHAPIEDRVRRARFALGRVGMSVLGAAVTTTGACIILLFCWVQIFVIFGVIVAVTAAASIFFSLFSLAAMLIIVGPEGDSGEFAKWARWCLCMGGNKKQNQNGGNENDDDRGGVELAPMRGDRESDIDSDADDDDVYGNNVVVVGDELKYNDDDDDDAFRSDDSGNDDDLI